MTDTQLESKSDERKAFEQWYATNAFDYPSNPIGSRECGLQWKAWEARAALSVPESLPQTRTMVINDRAFEITFVENGGYYFVPKEWLPPVRDAASLTYHFTQASRKAGDASQPEQCEWKYDENGEFRSACGGAYMSDIGANPSDYMTFCYGCGKKIKFVAQEDDE